MSLVLHGDSAIRLSSVLGGVAAEQDLEGSPLVTVDLVPLTDVSVKVECSLRAVVPGAPAEMRSGFSGQGQAKCARDSFKHLIRSFIRNIILIVFS